jgi:hypothetical protein
MAHAHFTGQPVGSSIQNVVSTDSFALTTPIEATRTASGARGSCETLAKHSSFWRSSALGAHIVDGHDRAEPGAIIGNPTQDVERASTHVRLAATSAASRLGVSASRLLV